MTKPLISIIIPAYNIESCLPATLESVLAQTYPHLEIIVVNDGSKDGTADVINTYAAKDSRIKAIHKENGGVTSARLRGVSEAGGEWIGFVDGDDFIEPTMYEMLLTNAVNHQAEISHCGYQMVFPNGRIDYYYNTGKTTCHHHAGGIKSLLAGEFEPGLWNKLFHRSLFCHLLKDNLMPTDIRINEDLLMNYYLFKEAKSSVHEDVCPYHYVLRKGSAATSKLNAYKLWDPLRVTKIILADVPADARPEAYRRYVRMLISGASMRITDSSELILPYRTEVRRELRKHIKEILPGHECGLKLKIMALWTAVWPAGYSWVHRIHDKITGNDHKYDLD